MLWGPCWVTKHFWQDIESNIEVTLAFLMQLEPTTVGNSVHVGRGLSNGGCATSASQRALYVSFSKPSRNGSQDDTEIAASMKEE